tara:strand:- start:3391 stop:3711 length:321 start_codon:yes stop_codon:yes gene_type:complete
MAELQPRCGNCGAPHREHTPRREAKPICRAGGIYRPATEEELDRFYQEAFPEGLKPIATIRFDNPEEMARAKAALSPEALTQHFGPGGGGVEAITAILKGEANGVV